MDKPCGVQRNWKLSLTLGCTSSVTNKASRLHAIFFFPFHSRFTGAQSVENEVSYVLSNRFMIRYNAHVVLWNTKCWCWIRLENGQVFVTTFSDVARCCACFANPFTTSSNTIQQCFKTFRWNVACVWPGLYNAAKLLLKNRWFTQTSLIQRKEG